MASQRDIRRLTLQMLYQLDARGGSDHEDIVQSLLRAAHDPGHRFAGAWEVGTLEDRTLHERAFSVARKAWEQRAEADRIASQLAPDWPTHRQPTIDRNVIRLCWYEMNSGQVPPKAAVNEAVELSKEFGTDRSSAFLNGVLDRMLKRVLNPPQENAEAASIEPHADEADDAQSAQVSSDIEQTEYWISD